MWATFERAEMLAPGSTTFYFRPEQPLHYMAGQFVQLRLPHADMDARGELRWFMLTSIPSEGVLSIAATFPEPGSSYKQALRRLKPGARLQVGDPLGDFVLPKDPSVPMVWMAGGIGSASFVGMAKELTTAVDKRGITLFQSAHRSEGLLFNDHWQLANLDVHQTVTGPDETWSGRRGRFSAHDLRHAAHHPDNTLFYLSGSSGMVDDLANQLVFLGVQPAQIVRQALTGY